MTTKLKIKYCSVEALVPYARNARTHTDEQIAEIAASIKEFGFTNPILVDGELGIIAGHGRLLAAQQLGIQEVPTVALTDMSEAQKRAYILADNKLAENAGWSNELLALEIGELSEMDIDLSLIGFTADEISSLIASAGAMDEGLTDPDEAPDLQDDPVSKAGDIWRMGKHRLMCGDSTNSNDVSLLLDGAAPHLMVTDPPYGVDYDPDWRNRAERKNGEPYGGIAVGIVTNDNNADWREAWSLFPGGVAYVWHADIFYGEVQDSLKSCDFELRRQIVWAKTNFVISRGHYHLQHESCLYAVKNGATGHWAGDRSQTTLWQISHNKSETGHSTQKPVECMKRPIENNSIPGDSVYEPFSGSGTTIIAAEQTGRACYAMEISPNYVDVAVRRWQEFTGKSAVLESTGKTFNEIAGEIINDA